MALSRSDLPGQLELPDTGERTAALARLKAAAPLRPTALQTPCDIGLFAPADTQAGLFGPKPKDGAGNAA
jgi:hypothetical protein